MNPGMEKADLRLRAAFQLSEEDYSEFLSGQLINHGDKVAHEQ